MFTWCGGINITIHEFLFMVGANVTSYKVLHSGKKKVETIWRIPSHGVAVLGAFGIEGGNPFRDCIDSLLIDLEG